MDKKYNAILNTPRPVSGAHPRMSLSRRAAQFAPFAALTGYDAVIRETARHTETTVTLDEGEIAVIDRTLRLLKANLGGAPAVFVRFFQPDCRKDGGNFVTMHSRVVKIDESLQEMTLQNGQIIRFQQIVQIIPE